MKVLYSAMGVFILAVLFLLDALRSPQSDGVARYETFLSLFSDKPIYSKYSTIQPFLAKLLDVIMRPIFPSLPESFVPRGFEIILLVVFISLAIVLLKSRKERIIILAGLLPLSMLANYAGQFFSEWTSSILLAIGFVIYSGTGGFAGVFVGAAVAALGFANWFVLIAPLVAVFLMATIGYFLGLENDRRFVLFLLASVVFSIFFWCVDYYVKGFWLSSSYLSQAERGFATVMPYSGLPGFSHPLLIGLFGNVFSLGKSVFLYNPFLIFIFIGKYRFKCYMIVAFVCTILIYSKWWAWYGGFSFGTRFYIFAIIPSMYIFIVSMLSRHSSQHIYLNITVLVLAVWLAIVGKYFGLHDVAGVCSANKYAVEAFCWYVPEFTPLINPFITHGFVGILARIAWYDYVYILSVFWLYVLMRRYGSSQYATLRQP